MVPEAISKREKDEVVGGGGEKKKRKGKNKKREEKGMDMITMRTRRFDAVISSRGFCSGRSEDVAAEPAMFVVDTMRRCMPSSHYELKIGYHLFSCNVE